MKAPRMTNIIDDFYVALEDRFRGTATVIRQRQMTYIPLVLRALNAMPESLRGSISFLDIGCGRGEWLSLLREHAVPCRGVDMNQSMVEICTQSGHQVDCANALELLRRLPNDSLFGVSAFHVIEHIDLKTGLGLLTEILRCLAPGGIAFFETPNPENLRVSGHNFYIDPTHTKPVPPPLLQFMFEFCGFQGNEIVRLQPTDDFSSKWAMKGIPAMLPFADATQFMLQYFCAAQDYSVVGIKAPPPAGLLPAMQ